MSPFIEAALALRQQCRDDFEDHRAAAYMAAEEACTVMLNARGRRQGIDPYSLFMGNRARAYAYASEELVDWWESHTRPTYAEFERQTHQLYQ